MSSVCGEEPTQFEAKYTPPQNRRVPLSNLARLSPTNYFRFSSLPHLRGQAELSPCTAKRRGQRTPIHSMDLVFARPDLSILSTPAIVRSIPSSSFQSQFCDSKSHGHDILQARISGLTTESCISYLEAKENPLRYIHLPILPPNGVSLRESTLLPRTANDSQSAFDVSPAILGPWVHGQLDGPISGGQLWNIPVSPRISSSIHFPHIPITTDAALGATPSHDSERTSGLAEHRDGQQEDYDTGGIPLHGSLSARGDSTNDPVCTAEVSNDDGDDDDDSHSECSSIDSTLWSVLFEEVSLMVGMSDYSVSCDSSQTEDLPIRDYIGSSIDKDESYSSKSSEALGSARTLGLSGGTRHQVWNLPQPPLTYARLASRPADHHPRAVSNGERGIRSQGNKHLLRASCVPSRAHFLERKVPLRQQRSMDVVGLQLGSPPLANHRMSPHRSESAVDVSVAYTSPHEPPLATPLETRSPAVDKLHPSPAKLKAHAPHQQRGWRSDGGVSTVPLKNNGSLRSKKPSHTTATRPAVQSTVPRRAVTFVSSVNSNRPLRRVPDSCSVSRANTLPTMATRNHPHPFSTPAVAEPRSVKSFMDMDVPSRKFGKTSPGRTRSWTSDGKMRKFIRSASRLRRRIIAWGKKILNG
ncbi:hypothetical protein EDC04DRAFT_3140407 [Pisolithus marmoratus]|nr:hypothetical protein EDC04DRAFT_3140407 [Pisolithus marmoratus]